MAKKKQRGKEGSVQKYMTRTQALRKLQIKLPEFRRLCILKAIHPREPKRKVHGSNVTYYHTKDINFLAHEPLLNLSRDAKAFERKIVRAKGRGDREGAERLERKRAKLKLDHLVKERYPSFLDALRDVDDALTLLHLFALLPAHAALNIPTKATATARRLSLEWKAYITRTHSLRKVFVSVKGIYFQASVGGQNITWLVPHEMPQIIPTDVDFRVMLTFLEFYQTLLKFVNFKLYSDLGLSYPPLLDPRLEQAAADLYALLRGMAAESGTEGGRLRGREGGAEGTEADGEGGMNNETKEAAEKGSEERGVRGSGSGEAKEGEERRGGGEMESEQLRAERQASAIGMAQLQARLRVMDAKLQQEGEEEEGRGGMESAREVIIPKGGDEEDDEETRTCRCLFQGLVFFLSREVPREMLLFVIRSFGGQVAWEGEGSSLLESSDLITHQIVDRCSQQHRRLGREYVQPQWVLDSANCRLLLPTAPYHPGCLPPPHLSPFVDNEAEGYLPDYAAAVERLKRAAEEQKGGGDEVQVEDEGAMEAEREEERRAVSNMRSDEMAAEARAKRLEAEEVHFASELQQEIAGVVFSQAGRDEAAKAENKEHRSVRMEQSEVVKEEGEEEEQREIGSRHQMESFEEMQFAQMMMPRKRQELFKAMQMGRAKKKASIDALEKRKSALSQGKMGKTRALI